MVDISESRGYSFFKDKEINISYFEELKCELLNQDPIQKSNMLFQFQIYAGEIDNMFQQDFGDEFYYFFCNENCSEGNVFVQIT